MDSLDIVQVHGYEFFPKHRKQRVLRKSAGIGTFIKLDVVNYCNFIKSDCDYVQWINISQKLFNCEEDVIFGVTYIPPEISKYFQNLFLNTFMKNLKCTVIIIKYVIIMGDLNARTLNLQDIVYTDETIFRAISSDSQSICENGAFYEINKLDGFAIHRISNDTTSNRLGRRLVDFCMVNNLVILNGRSFNDMKGNLHAE